MSAVELPPVWGESLTKGLISQSCRDNRRRLENFKPSITSRSLQGRFDSARRELLRQNKLSAVISFVTGAKKRQVGWDITCHAERGGFEVVLGWLPIRAFIDRPHTANGRPLAIISDHAAMRVAGHLKDATQGVIGRLAMPHVLMLWWDEMGFSDRLEATTANADGLAHWRRKSAHGLWVMTTFIATSSLDGELWLWERLMKTQPVTIGAADVERCCRRFAGVVLEELPELFL